MASLNLTPHLVSVVIRTRNRPRLLARALAGLAAQTFRNFEVVVVNDGGDRAAVEAALAASGLPDRVRVIHRAEPAGKFNGISANAGVRASQGEFVLIHDDDDLLAPEFLAKTTAAFTPDVHGVVTRCHLVKERFDGDRPVEVSREIYNEWQDCGVDLFRLAESNTFPPVSFLFRRSAFETVGGFRENISILNDWVFHLEMVARHRVGFVPEVLCSYHQRVEADGGEAGNIAGFDRQKELGAIDIEIRNTLLREDLAAGRFGLGSLVAMAHGQGQIFSWVKEK